MRRFTVELQPAQRQSMAVPPSSFLYVESITTDRALNLRAFGANGESLTNLESVVAGTRLRVDPLGTRFVTVEVSNTSTTANTVVLYVGTDEILPPVVGGGGGGGGAITGTVSIDSARGLNLYSGQIVLSATGTSLRTLLPAGAVMSDWAVRCATGEMKVGSSVSSGGITLEAGKGLAGSNDYQMTLWTTSSATAELMVTYR